MRPARWIVLAAAVLCACRDRQPAQTQTTTQTPVVTTDASATPKTHAPSPPSVGKGTFAIGGRELVVTLTIDRSTILASEPVHATFAIAAADRAKAAEIEASWFVSNDLGRPDSYTFTLVAADGTEVPERKVAFTGMGNGPSQNIDLSQRDHQTRLLVAKWVQAPIAPGTYKLRAEMKSQGRLSAKGPWEPFVAMAEAPLVVVADDPGELDALIVALETQALAKANWDRAGEAVRELVEIRDPRVVPSLVRICESDDYEHIFTAIMALGDFTDDRALAALVHTSTLAPSALDPARYTTDALRVQSAAALRHATAVALSESPNPKALDALFAMKDDADSSVRLTVLHRAARLPDPTGLALIQGFTKDPAPIVVGEANRYLAERGK
jgi:hypothetical protein